jgi:hypothetical protein
MDEFGIKFWNGKFWCRGKFPNGKGFELKSDTDLLYEQWKEKVEKAWEEAQNPEPEPDECKCPECKKTFVCENRR